MSADFSHKPKSCFELFTSDEHRQAIDALTRKYLEFLSQCKTERETVNWAVKILEDQGFSTDPASPAFMRVKRGKSLIMARKGRRPLREGFRLLGAHGDTPRLDLKQRPLYEETGLGMAKTHYYGGIRKYQWLARPLALHGVIVKADGTVIPVVIGEDPTDPCLVIADLLPHLAYKQVEQKVSEAFEAEKLNIILGHEPLREPEAEEGEGKDTKKPEKPVKAMVLKLLNERYGVVEEDLITAELQIVPAGPARLLGLDGALIGGYGHDDRACVFCAVQAFLAEKEPEHTQIVIIWDKEEIGSEGSTGAKSKFMEYAVQDLIEAWDPGARFSQVMDAAKAISADVHAPIDPDFQELHEKLNSSLMGYGPVFCKFTGSRGKAMANDAHPEYFAWLRGLLNDAGVPWQSAELGKVDVGGGGTVAMYLAEYGLDIIDCGPSVLSMHSPFEILSKYDLHATALAFRAFLKS